MKAQSLDDDLIYPGARISNAVSMLLIMAFCITHKLSGAVVKDLLSLIDIHCLKHHHFIRSLYKFKQYFTSLRSPLVNHYYCPRCNISVNSDTICCPNASCHLELTVQNKCFFIQLSIADQLKAFFHCNGFYIDLMYRFNRVKCNGENIEDVYDGLNYQQHYVSTDPTGPRRTSVDIEMHSREAISIGKPVLGIKGPSWLSTIPKYDLVGGNVIDYMHCVLLSLTKMLLKLWFDSENSQELWYCGSQVKNADLKLLQIKPPATITRVPRSIQQHRRYWKAAEYRAWLLFYSIPVMLNILPTEYLAHHMLLVESVFILLQTSISPTMITKAEMVIKHYCFKMQAYYSMRCMTANLHHLLHLPQIVLQHGPLHTYSCFPFESMNGRLLSLIKGTQYVDRQIIEAVGITQKLPYIVQDKLPSNSEAATLYKQITGLNCIAENSVVIGSNCFDLGSVDHIS